MRSPVDGPIRAAIPAEFPSWPKSASQMTDIQPRNRIGRPAHMKDAADNTFTGKEFAR